MFCVIFFVIVGMVEITPEVVDHHKRCVVQFFRDLSGFCVQQNDSMLAIVLTNLFAEISNDVDTYVREGYNVFHDTFTHNHHYYAKVAIMSALTQYTEQRLAQLKREQGNLY